MFSTTDTQVNRRIVQAVLLLVGGAVAGCSAEASDGASGWVLTRQYPEGVATSRYESNGDITSALTAQDGRELAALEWNHVDASLHFDEGQLRVGGTAENTTLDAQATIVHELWASARSSNQGGAEAAPGDLHVNSGTACTVVSASNSGCFTGAMWCGGTCTDWAYGSCTYTISCALQ